MDGLMELGGAGVMGVGLRSRGCGWRMLRVGSCEGTEWCAGQGLRVW